MRYEIWGRSGCDKAFEAPIFIEGVLYKTKESAEAKLVELKRMIANEMWVKALPDDTDRLEWLLKNSDKLDQKMSGWRIEGIKGFFKTAREAIDAGMNSKKDSRKHHESCRNVDCEFECGQGHW